MGDISYDFAHIQELASQIKSVSGQIESLLVDLSQEVAKLAAGWEGEAQETWHALQAKWNQEADDLKTTLHDLSGKVEEAGHSMQTAESSITNKFTV